MPKKPAAPKAPVAAPKPRNPMVGLVHDPMFRHKRHRSAEEKDDRHDPLSRKAKHKKPTTLEEFYQIGDHVEVVSGPVKEIISRSEKLRKKGEKAKEGNIEAIVRSHGPSGTLGVTIDGEYHLIDPDDIELIYESFNSDNFEDLVEWSYTTTSAGFQVPISSEEQSILDKCLEKTYKNSLDDREQEVARLMVSKGVLRRKKDDRGIFFSSAPTKLARF